MHTDRAATSCSIARRLAAIVATAALAAAACGPGMAPARSLSWVVGRAQPRFDPGAPADPTRWALERLLTRGLVERDTAGRAVPVAAERIEVSADRLTYTFHLRAGLRFTNGKPCGSEHFRRAIESGLARSDHSTAAWLLSALRGVDKLRAGKPLPALGVETPDPGTLRIVLARPDSMLLEKLALPGMSSAWERLDVARWVDAHGLGPYRSLRADSVRRLVMLRDAAAGRVWSKLGILTSAPDTVQIRFAIGASRVRSLIRQSIADVVWPLPPGLLVEPIPEEYRLARRDAWPTRWLLLVMRADLPPTSRLPTRHALAHGLNRSAMVRALGATARDESRWFPGAPPYDFPKLDVAAARRWMETAKLGRTFHVDLAYDADGPAAEIARAMQGEWAKLAIYIELRSLRGEALRQQQLRGLSHLLLVEDQALLDRPEAQIASLVMPLRGPTVGGFRTGWRTREFDPWIAPTRPAPPFPAGEAQRRLDEERVAVPIAALPWVWIERKSAPALTLDPRFGPEVAGRVTPTLDSTLRH